MHIDAYDYEPDQEIIDSIEDNADTVVIGKFTVISSLYEGDTVYSVYKTREKRWGSLDYITRAELDVILNGKR